MATIKNFFSFFMFDPRFIESAKKNNEEIFNLGPVLGIEVTIPMLAERCFANIDPQHADGVNQAAIEAAMDWPLPKNGTVLATIRPDLDSIGSMALFLIRKEAEEFGLGGPGSCPDCGGTGYHNQVDSYNPHGYGTLCSCLNGWDIEFQKRVKAVAESDRFARGGWPGPRPLLSNEDGEGRLAAIAAAVADFKIPLEERVGWMRSWLLSGEEPKGYREKYLAEREEISRALKSGDIKARLEGGIAVVESTHRAATSIGYRLAPVVVALNQKFSVGSGKPHRKFTVCQFTKDEANLSAALSKLNEIEEGWGGSPTIGGSPQGMNSTLTAEEVVRVIQKHLFVRCGWCKEVHTQKEWNRNQKWNRSIAPICPSCNGV